MKTFHNDTEFSPSVQESMERQYGPRRPLECRPLLFTYWLVCLLEPGQVLKRHQYGSRSWRRGEEC